MFSKTLSSIAVVVAVAAFSLTTLPASRADACGGFFCNSAQPVNQAAERIIFTQHESGDVTAVIQIQYQGPSDEFAWMLPVAGTPTPGVSSNAAFDRLQQASNPFYQLNTVVEGTCADSGARATFASDSSGPTVNGGQPPAPEEAVTVLDQGSVGPYNYVIISVDPMTPDLADEALTWLRDNGYDVTDFGGDLLRLYLEQGLNLLAFKLNKGNDAGSIRPVVLNFGAGLPSIPIQPTAVAASDDMGVMVWVLGEHRAIPANYRHLELNEALLNWMQPTSNYNDVVIRAANEAGGQGFVTEFAGQAEPFAETIFATWEREQWQAMSTDDWTGREGELIANLQNFAALDGMRDLYRAMLPVPPGVTDEEFLACVACYYPYDIADIDGFEPGVFLDEMLTRVIEPMEETRALFEERPYVTRLYTTMSAHEMTLDPVFDFNTTLGDYSNVHTADRFIECSPSVSQFEAPWRVELPSGEVIRGEGQSWPFDTEFEAMPANRRILRVGTEGEGEVVEDNVGAITAALTEHNESVPGPRGGGCSVGAVSRGAGTALPLGFLLLAVLARRRRRA